MIYEQPEEQYHRVRPIFQNRPNHPDPFCDRWNNPARIYVDDLDNPRTVLVWAKLEMFYLAAVATNKAINKALEAYIVEHIVPEAVEIGEVCFQVNRFRKSVGRGRSIMIWRTFCRNDTSAAVLCLIRGSI